MKNEKNNHKELKFTNEEIINLLDKKLEFGIKLNTFIGDKTTREQVENSIYYSEEDLYKISKGEMKIEKSLLNSKKENEMIYYIQKIATEKQKIDILNEVIRRIDSRKNKNDGLFSIDYSNLKLNLIRILTEMKLNIVEELSLSKNNLLEDDNKSSRIEDIREDTIYYSIEEVKTKLEEDKIPSKSEIKVEDINYCDQINPKDNKKEVLYKEEKMNNKKSKCCSDFFNKSLQCIPKCCLTRKDNLQK